MAKINVTLSDGTIFVAPDKATADLVMKLDQDKVKAQQTIASTHRDATVTVKANPIGQPLPSGGTGKGNIGVYGLGRFPVTLYATQWPKLAQELPTIAAVILRDSDRLSFRDDASKQATLEWARRVSESSKAQQSTPAAPEGENAP